MLEKEIAAIKREADELESRLSSGELTTDELRKFSKRHAECNTILETARELESALKNAEETRQAANDPDKELAELAQMELPEAEARAAELEKKLQLLMVN